MDIGQRIDVIKQGAELAQKSGALTLDDAYNAKVALMSIESNGPNMDAINELIKTLEKGRTNGAYSFQDSYYIYIAINDIESSISTIKETTENKSSTKQKKGGM